MKQLFTFIATIAIAAIAFGCQKAAAQTSTSQVPNLLTNLPVNPTISGGLQQVWDAATTSTNFALVAGAGRSLHGQNLLAFADYVYNLSDNVGVVLGYDAIRSKVGDGHITTYNFVKGGVQLSAKIAPFKNFGLPNVYLTPFGGILMSSSGGSVGQIVYTGLNYRIPISSSWAFNLGALYENRTGGQTDTEGAYLGGHIAFSHAF